MRLRFIFIKNEANLVVYMHSIKIILILLSILVSKCLVHYVSVHPVSRKGFSLYTLEQQVFMCWPVICST